LRTPQQTIAKYIKAKLTLSIDIQQILRICNANADFTIGINAKTLYIVGFDDEGKRIRSTEKIG